MGDVNYTGDAEPISDESLCEIMRDINKYYDVSSCDFESLYVRMKDAERQRDEALAALKASEEALKPFADFAQWVDAEGWTCNIHREGISVWFGPSDFRRARSALENSKARLADATNNPVPLTLSGSDAEGRDDG